MSGPSAAIRSECPNATSGNDGLMSKEYAAQLDAGTSVDMTLGWCLDFPGDATAHRAFVNFDYFWPRSVADGGSIVSLKSQIYRVIIAPRIGSDDRYDFSDGFGGTHGGGLHGWVLINGILYPAGNYHGSDGLSYNNAIMGAKPGEWVERCNGLDVDAGFAAQYINGIIAARQVWTGDRYCGPTVAGGTRRLYLGGPGDHSIFDGRIQAASLMEGPDSTFPFVIEQGYPAGGILQSQYVSFDQATIQEVNLLCDLSRGGGRMVPDLSSGAPDGYTGRIHAGRLHGMNLDTGAGSHNDGVPFDGGTWQSPLPRWVQDPKSLLYSLTSRPVADPTLYPALTPPGGLLAYHSFGGAETTTVYEGIPFIPPLEGGVAAGTVTEYGALPPGTTSSWCTRAYQAVCLSSPQPGSFAFWRHGSFVANCDLRVSRVAPTTAGNENAETPGNKTGLVFRLSDALNYWVAWCNKADEIVVFPVSGGARGDQVITATPVRFGGGASINWSILRIVCSGTTITLGVDDSHGGFVQLAQATGQAFNQAATGVGLSNWNDIFLGTASSQMPRWMQFSLRQG